MSRDERRAARDLGARAEGLVCDVLRGRGYAILGTNVRVGRAEIDIVARRGRLLAFCEVRARSGPGGPHPLETIDAAKQRRLRRAAIAWAMQAAMRGHAIRLDAAAVTFDGAAPIVDYREDAF
ncbi:MAG: YraN family protein [Sandaracinaceae bacterium]|nr:YraN family protein [Sandaracinaceae bacterium]